MLLRGTAYLFMAVVLCTTSTSVNSQTGVGTTGAEGPWKAIQAAALKEGRVVLYSVAAPPIHDRLTADFAKVNPGITLEIVRLSGSVIVAKVDQERISGVDGADVVVAQAISWMEEASTNGQYIAPSGPAARLWPGEYLRRGTIPILSLDPIMIAFNTNLVKTPVSGYQDLLRPEFKGKIGVVDPKGNPAVMAWFDWLEKTQGPDFVPKFLAQSPRLFVSSVTGIQSLAAGEFMVSAWAVPPVTLPLIEKGAPLKVVVPKPGLGIRFGGAILKRSKRPNAALVLMDYLTSLRGQTAWSSKTGTASVLPGVPDVPDAKAINALDDAPYTDSVMKAFMEKWNQRMKAR